MVNIYMRNEMDNLNAVLEKLNEIRELVESKPVGTYIYRGESEHFKEVSSNLYRFCRNENLPIRYPFGIQSLLENSLRKYRRFTDKEEEAEFADMVQHYGGLTNRIDFTSDYLIALFFACHGSSDKNGRIIVLEQDKVSFPGVHNYCQIKKLESTNNRIIAQKSILVIPEEGFIDIKQEGVNIVNIPKNLKRYVLQFLLKHHGISVETIYGDFAGVIRLQRVYLAATTYYLQGNDYILQDQYDLALKKFGESIKLDSNYAVAYQGRGIVHAYIDDNESAIDNFNEAIKASQYNAKSYLSRGNVYAKIGDYKHAIADFEKADQVLFIRDDVVLQRIYLSLGNAHQNSEDYDAAIKVFNHAIRILPDFQDRSGWRPSDEEVYRIASEIYNSRGKLHMLLGEDGHAIADFNKAIELEKHNFLPYLNLSDIYIKMNKNEKAIDCFDKLSAIMLKSNFAVYLCRGHFYTKINEYEKAIDDFNEALKILKTEWYIASASYYFGLFFAKIGNLKYAIKNISKAVNIQQYSHKWIVAALYNRYNAYLKIGNVEKAEEDLSEAIELEPELTGDSLPCFLLPVSVLYRHADIYLSPVLNNWEVDLSPDFEK